MIHHRRPTSPRRVLVLAICTALGSLVACAPTPTTGTLEIVVTGLPTGTDADVFVGTQAVAATTSLTLAAGPHEVTARSVVATADIMGDRYAPDETSIDTTVTAGQTTTVTITYSMAQQALLLAPTVSSGVINVLTSDDLVAGGNASTAWSTDPLTNDFTGMALGPDGRLYVSDRDNDRIVVIDAADLTATGTVAPAAVITNAGLVGPMGAAFDSDGNLWIGTTYVSGVLLRFDGVLGATGAVDLAPALVVTVDDSTYAAPFFAIYDVFVDHLDNVWVTDLVNNAVYRFDDLAGLTGAQSIVPDLYLESAASTISDSFSTMDAPVSLVVDLDGTLYVGTESYNVPRFDDALALTGFQNLEASAYLDTAVDFPYMVALDQSGALWVGHLSGTLVRLPDPTSYTDYADVSGDLDLQLSWVADGGTGYPDGGTITFVPTQGPHAGY